MSTPDIPLETLDELERLDACAGLLSALGAIYSNASERTAVQAVGASGRALKDALLLIRQARAERDRAARERDELRRLVKDVLAVHDASASTGSCVYEMHPNWVRDARTALAQKEPKP